MRFSLHISIAPRLLLIMITALVACVALVATSAHAAEGKARSRMLIVVSSHGADGGKTRPGFEMDELTQAYLIFANNGLDVDIASPAGGAVVADEFDAAKPYNAEFLKDPVAKAKLDKTFALTTLSDARYNAIFVIGGKGAMFDLPVNAELKAMLAKTHDAGGVIGAVCHGPAVFINLATADGRSLVSGRAITGFSNEEERLFGKRWVPAFPVLLEDGLIGAGARYSDGPMMLSHVVTDGRLVTGQNPYSTAETAEAMLAAMGHKPKQRKQWADERSVALISDMLAGRKDAARAMLVADPTAFDVPLIAIWGYYHAQAAGSDRAALLAAVEVMELAAPHYKEPQLASAIIDARAKLANLQ